MSPVVVAVGVVVVEEEEIGKCRDPVIKIMIMSMIIIINPKPKIYF